LVTLVASLWSTAPLGAVLTRARNRIELRDDESYRQVTVRLHHRGVVQREILSGDQIRTKRQYVASAGQLVLSRIDARNGAIGLVPEGLDGAVVTSDFWLYDIDKSQVEPPFLDLYVGTPSFVESCTRASEGTTNRVRLQEPRFLDIRVPIPPLDEQRRIVARIDELAALIEEAHGLRAKATAEAEALIAAEARQMLALSDVAVTELREWLDSSREGIQTGPFGTQLGASDFVDAGVPVLTIGNVQYGGLDLAELKHVGSEKAQDLSRYAIRAGDILFARMGTVGRCCVAPTEVEGWLINYHIIRVALDKERVEPRFIHWTLRSSADVSEYLDNATRGSTRKGVNSRIVAFLPCRVPPLREQRRIVAHLDQFQVHAKQLAVLQQAAAGGLDALLPSVLDRVFKGEL
jgi:type I restriction enzyme S subunit